MDPPSYDESASAYRDQQSVSDSKRTTEAFQRFSIREEVGASRTQHVCALVSRLLPQIRERARHGLSKSTLLMIPSDQDACRKGELVGFPSDETPVMIQLDGQQDTMEFWTQQQALEELQTQFLMALSNSMPTVVEPLPKRPAPPPAVKSSFWSRKQKARAPSPKPVRSIDRAPISVNVYLDEMHLRTETEFGLFETLRGRCVVIEVHVR